MWFSEPNPSEFWQAVRGKIDGEPVSTPVERAIVVAARMCVAAGLTLTFDVVVLALQLAK
jgi:hypothetical protein